ncbi:trp operon leader peptide [Salmonella enterica]|nr:trp operon leader peptide [Salmonella enterica]EKF6405780.1 trp operon leader peptide [Salmonella enterica]
MAATFALHGWWRIS